MIEVESMISYPVTGGQYSLNFKLKTHSEQMENDISVLAAGLAMTQQTINSTRVDVLEGPTR